MSKWECIVCGWVYDEKVGDPDSGIAAGTRWEDIPDDWLCPDCGVGKEDFEMIEKSEESDLPHHEEPASASNEAAIVVIGTGLAGYGLVRELRKHDKDSPVIMITADDGRAYSKPMLSTGFTKNTDADALAQKDAGGMGEDLNASVWTLTKVTAIDTAAQIITIGDKETQVHYKKLVLALGADVIRPPVKGNAQDYIYSVNDLLDYDDFRTAVTKNNVKKVCIIGGGLIGCEFTNDLINGGIATETVDPLAYCLPTLLPEAAGKAVQAGLEAKGAKFHFGQLVTEVNKAADGLVVSLKNGDTINCDLVLSAVGVRPQIKLAQDAGITVNRGITTNRLLETSAPNVYAMGDCAEVAGHVLVYVAPLMAQARALAKTLSGQNTEVSYPAMPVTIKTPACPVTVSPAPRDAAGNWEVEQDGLNVVARFVGSDGQLLGFALTGDGTKQKMTLQKLLPPIMA
jgi:rubredoxin-NAD+ reductase